MTTMARWDPFRVLARIDDEFDGLVRRAGWNPAFAASRTLGFVPACDVTAEGRDVVIHLELPGVDASKDVDVRIDGNRLMITGERQEMREGSEEDGHTLVRELRYGSFRREFALPEGVTPADVEASYDRGLLTVRVKGVRQEAPASARIEITVPPDGGTVTPAGG